MPDRPITECGEVGLSGADPARSREKLFTSTPRLLCVCGHEPSWMALTLGLSQAGLGPPRIVWVSTPREAVARLRDEPIDCVLIDVPPTGASIRDDQGPFGLLRALRTAGCTEPAVFVGRLFTDAEWTEACACDGDVFVSPRGWNSPALGGLVQRAVVRGGLVRENRRLTTADERRLLRERDESEQLLAQQRQIIAELEALPDPLQVRPGQPRVLEHSGTGPLPAFRETSRSAQEFADRYAALLRSYVLMGSGNLGNDISDLAEDFVAARVAPPEALQLHLNCVESLVKGLGNRSARHVVARGDLLAVELMTHLAQRSQRSFSNAAASKFRAASALPIRNVTGISGIDLADADAAA